MWLDEYNELNNGERERFARLVNYLLNKTYLTREIYEGKQGDRHLRLSENLCRSLYRLCIDAEQASRRGI